jgi:hypothetical protein
MKKYIGWDYCAAWAGSKQHPARGLGGRLALHLVEAGYTDTHRHTHTCVCVCVCVCVCKYICT